MKITKEQVKTLRIKTGAGILKAKKALEVCHGNFDEATKWLKKQGIADASKKKILVAGEGQVVTLFNQSQAVMLEISCETDFVAKTKKFQDLITLLGRVLLKTNFSNKIEAEKILFDKLTLKEHCLTLSAIVGEKIALERVIKFSCDNGQYIGCYTHFDKQSAAMVKIQGGNQIVANDLAMQVVALNPSYLNFAAIPKPIIFEIKNEIDQELKNVFKPKNIKEKIFKGKLNAKLADLMLVNQEFIKEKITVSKYLANNQAEEIAMAMFEIGEKVDN